MLNRSLSQCYFFSSVLWWPRRTTEWRRPSTTCAPSHSATSHTCTGRPVRIVALDASDFVLFFKSWMLLSLAIHYLCGASNINFLFQMSHRGPVLLRPYLLLQRQVRRGSEPLRVMVFLVSWYYLFYSIFCVWRIATVPLAKNVLHVSRNGLAMHLIKVEL